MPTHKSGDDTSANVISTLASHASVAVALPKTGAAGQLIGEVTAGQVIVGGVISWTMIVALQVEVLPQSSVAIHVLVTLYVFPHVGVVTSVDEISTLASHSSVAVAAAKDGVAGQLIGEVTEGQVMTEGVTSCTAMVRLHVEVLPQSSIAVQVLVTL